MKAVVAIVLIIIFGAMAPAQNRVDHESKVQPRQMDLLLDDCTVRIVPYEEVAREPAKVTRLYKRANTRIEKALNFRTKYTKAKLA